MNWFKQHGFTLFRWIVALLCFIFLGYKLADSGNEISSALDVFSQAENTFLLCIVIALMFVNWGIEAFKWKLGASTIEKINYKNSFYSVLAGLAVSMVGPNRTGEFLGRITALSPDKRMAGSFVSVHISLAQTVVTLVVGFCSVLLLDPAFLPVLINPFLLAILISLLSIISLVVYYRFRLVFKVFKRPPFLKWFSNLKLEEVAINNRTLSLNLFLSLLRYAVFISQFVILMKISGIPLNIPDMYIASALIYLLMAVLPSFALADLGIRGTVSVYVMGLFGITSTPVIIAASVLWVVNIAVPAAAGAVVLAFRK